MPIRRYSRRSRCAAVLPLCILLLPVAAIAAGPVDQEGAVLYAQNCSACHQTGGNGIVGAFPALARNTFVVGDPLAVARTVMDGRGGMPSFRSSLTDEQMGLIINYIRGSWGNRAVPIMPATFAKARGGTLPREVRSQVH
ncbi:c-type cytochrome [Gluconacetobacter aggeris]|uniref:c-type cytochrome n=1 Tax=Gluconacetobacter aggeris TaxID=1286186 RepID=UPI0038D021B5